MDDSPQVMLFRFDDAGEIPNNPSLPTVVYKRAVDPGTADLAALFESLYSRGGWRAAWRWGVYPFPHYHSTAHEVLGVYRGSASLRLGHNQGVTLVVEPGDVLVLPAGVGHENLGASDDFHVVGGYPEGQQPDLLRGKPGERPAADRAIAAVPLPAGDPVLGMGSEGAFVKAWGLK